MSSAINSALSGLHIAGQRLERAASRIAHPAAPSPTQSGDLPGTPSFTLAAPVGASPSALAAQQFSSFTDDLVSVKEAEILYKASAKLLNVIQRTEAELLDIET